MSDDCSHIDDIRDMTPSALGCEECLKIGSKWLHLRLCRTCGHVGCCDDSPNHHATKHFHATRHPIIEGYDPPEGWGWCYVDEVMLDLSDRATPHNGRIRRLVGYSKQAAALPEHSCRLRTVSSFHCPLLVKLKTACRGLSQDMSPRPV
jgi:hypothetical protein